MSGIGWDGMGWDEKGGEWKGEKGRRKGQANRDMGMELWDRVMNVESGSGIGIGMLKEKKKWRKSGRREVGYKRV